MGNDTITWRAPKSLMSVLRQLERDINENKGHRRIRTRSGHRHVSVVDIAHAMSKKVTKEYEDWEDELVEFLESDL